MEDYWYADKDWFKNDVPPAEQAQELLDCAAPGFPDLNCHDINQQGYANWHAYHDDLEPAWDLKRKPDSNTILITCPARREINTLDYKDVKVGLLTTMSVYGFYFVEDAENPGRVDPTQAGYTSRTGFPEGVVIEILLEANRTLATLTWGLLSAALLLN